MKTSQQISLHDPCTENFDTFKSTSRGGHCLKCNKEVIDFSAMSNSKIIELLSRKKEKTCGRFMSSQINYSNQRLHSGLLLRTLAFASISLLSLIVVPQAHAQSVDSNPTEMAEKEQKGYSVKGTVFDDQDLPLAGVNVVLEGTKEGTVTNFNGEFEFTRSLFAGDVLVFSFIGFEPKEYKITDSENEVIEVTINFDESDILLMGEVSIDAVYSSKGKKPKKSSASKNK